MARRASWTGERPIDTEEEALLRAVEKALLKTAEKTLGEHWDKYGLPAFVEIDDRGRVAELDELLEDDELREQFFVLARARLLQWAETALLCDPSGAPSGRTLGPVLKEVLLLLGRDPEILEQALIETRRMITGPEPEAFRRL